MAGSQTRLRITAAVLAGALTIAVGIALWLTRRALPRLDGALSVAGLENQVEVVRDPWGVPHIFAETDDAAYFALGYVHAQDRLFQLDLNRHIGQARLAELFGEPAVEVDRLFRTMDLHGAAGRMLARARPEARAASAAYARGVNAAVAELGGRLPLEFALLGHRFEPAEPDDFVGILGYMAWQLNIAWIFDPLYEQLVAKLGPEHAAELFPYNDGGSPSVHPPALGGEGRPVAGRDTEGATAGRPRLDLFSLSTRAQAVLLSLPDFRASNNWVIGPDRSASGHAILANDPHLRHGLPAIWYQAHLRSPNLDVTGVTLPGLPFVAIGHNRQIAWGFTNVMQDAADFFLERLDPARPGLVMHQGEWVELETRHETIAVKGSDPVELEIHWTPHGPIVNDLLPDQKEAVAYRWALHAAEHANEVDGFWLLNRARNWEEFRAALSRFGGIAQNVAYADAEGHIGMQTAGAFPRLCGRTDGTRFRVGWDGSEEWGGFHPFEENPASFDPAQGWLASANNPVVAGPGPFYVSSQWEPVDRITRIQEVLRAHPKLSVQDMMRLQADTVLLAARELTPLILEAFAARPPQDATVRAALERLEGWDGDMRAQEAAPTLFAAFYKRLFYEIFEDELGSELARGYRSQANLSATMMRAVISRGPERWFDRVDTAEREAWPDILRAAFEKAVTDLATELGGRPESWSWGRLHTLTFTHPLASASRLIAGYFNRGPFPVPGASGTVNKMEYAEGSFQVIHGPSMRQITDFADLNAALAVLPGGQSGIPTSPHYSDLMHLWLRDEYHPLPLDRGAIHELHRLVLEPLRDRPD